MLNIDFSDRKNTERYKFCKYVILVWRQYGSVEVQYPDGSVYFVHARAFCQLKQTTCVYYPCKDFERRSD